MVDLANISKIGFGGYRVSKYSQEHAQALDYAFRSGCNLIDTSTVYTNGASESLIGDVLSMCKEDVFIISKAGYINSSSEQPDQLAKKFEIDAREIVQLPNGSFHSIHPNFLEAEINASLKRLKISYIDCYLLHNPEYYFTNTENASKEVFYQRIKSAFEYLESKVRQGTLRYYGISSNEFAAFNRDMSLELNTILEIAKGISDKHNFKFIQFPFNCIENGAIISVDSNKSLVEMARENGLITLGNRPLNAIGPNGTIRLATYDSEIKNLDSDRDVKTIENFINVVAERLVKMEVEDDIMSFAPMQVIATGWKNFPNTETVDGVFDKRFIPFIQRIYENDIPGELLPLLSQVKSILLLYAKRNMTRETKKHVEHLQRLGILKTNDARSVSQAAIEYCFNSGIDHVLVGMRKPAYVDSCRQFFG